VETITVEKNKLLETVRKNRDDHRSQFLAAQEVYRERVIDFLNLRLKEARDGKAVSLVTNLVEPVDYTKEYDTAISMIEWSVEDSIDLSQRDFERYVLNKWEWSNFFAASTQSYLAPQ